MTYSSLATPERDKLSALAESRYRNGQKLSGTWNDAIEAILSHRSVRDYLAKTVPAQVIDIAVAAAQSAASSSNLQAWSVVVVEDKDIKDRLNAVAGNQRQIAQAPLLLVWLADLARPRSIAEEQGGTAEGLDYLESFLLGVIDAALAAQNAVVALESLGLGTCYIGAIRNDPQAVSRELGLSDGVFPVFGLTVGYPDPARPADIKPRLAQKAVVHCNHYDPDAHRAALGDYNRALATFQAEQAMPKIDWTEQVGNRIGTVAALKGRHVLKDVIRKLGIPLK